VLVQVLERHPCAGTHIRNAAKSGYGFGVGKCGGRRDGGRNNWLFQWVGVAAKNRGAVLHECKVTLPGCNLINVEVAG
jgi:hypothetical protein